ncbi:hypothetical protein [Demequina gelatinilytica]|uniref:hypothetical protein n=1 Tax=Demequina gelatinilytica TaxID=1638980 RepID=UPI0007823933|nr:hypothetical protein [Demequina gelatinilytica]
MGGRLRYSRTATAEAEARFASAARALETTIEARRRDVADAMAHYQATGVSDEYAQKERAWAGSADHVLEVVRTLRKAMRDSDALAADAAAQVRSIGQELGG